MDDHVEEQINYLFSVLEMLHLVPSTEFYYGFCCNLYINNDRTVTMFDYGMYKYGSPAETRAIRDHLVRTLYARKTC